ncbi:MAG: Flp pilus assembly complex ATPase component TadA [Firmicutes bacterium]|nr:Flp pilus assembly complex ATPase component TadA [[Eubacterium] siraeum]MCM1487945.1 Flp pilus assembly complex ATPase component TadA [Bacillota bacterium]
MKSVPIGQLLVESGYITEEQLNDALARQKTEFNGAKIGEVLLDLGYVSETQVVHALSARLKVPYIDLVTAKIDIDAVKKIPEDVARKNSVIGYRMQSGRLFVATNDPVNFIIFEELKISAGMEIVPTLATRSAINEAINRAYSQNTVSDMMNDINKEYDANEALMQAEDSSDERIDNAPVVKLVNTLVENAYRKNASDIHIEPFKSKTRIRFRIDGDLVEQMSVKANVHSALVTRIKILAGMNIAEKRIPLDGRYGVRVDGVNQDLRVSSIPTVYGEKVVIRLLATGDEKARKITDLGMTDYNYEMFSSILRCPHGVLLVTGPTGSGKSTTLYAALGELSKPDVNIVTVEDPVEKKMDGINQVQINDKAGMTFAAALRSILRQDPDIIMIGEIRDGETADIAIRAAITGHLVLSTLHTNDAAGTIMRLVDMGVAPYMVATSLIGVVAQRLVKLLCPHCKEKIILDDPADLRLIGREERTAVYAPRFGGCHECNGTGFKGRTAIHEIIVTGNDIKELISRNATAEEINEKARKNGTRLLRENVAEMVLAGTTTMEELVRATYSV